MLPSQYHVSIHLGKTSARMSQMVLVLKQTTIMSLDDSVRRINKTGDFCCCYPHLHPLPGPRSGLKRPMIRPYSSVLRPAFHRCPVQAYLPRAGYQ